LITATNYVRKKSSIHDKVVMCAEILYKETKRFQRITEQISTSGTRETLTVESANNTNRESIDSNILQLDQDALKPRYKLLNCRNHENENENKKQKANEEEEEEEELTRGAPAASRARRRHEATNEKKTVACCGLFLVCFRAAAMKFRIRCRRVAVPAPLIHAEPIC
jgi:hypothetical protein